MKQSINKDIDIALGKLITRLTMKGTHYNVITTVFIHVNHFTNTTINAE